MFYRFLDTTIWHLTLDILIICIVIIIIAICNTFVTVNTIVIIKGMLDVFKNVMMTKVLTI